MAQGTEVFHEFSHQLVLPLQDELFAALGDLRQAHGGVYHPIHFYLTGGALERVLLDYTQYLYSTGLFGRAWSQYRAIVETHWLLFVDGKISRAEAIKRTVVSLERD